MKRLLAVSYCFPPVASPEAFVSAKLMGALQGFKVDVISASPDLFPGRADTSLDQYVKDRFGRIERLTTSWPLRKLMLMPRLPLRPDRYVLLKSLALRRALDMQPANYDAVMTRSQYHSSHLVGLALKKLFPRLPWIASFSDPWTGGIYERTIPFLSAYSLHLEKEALTHSDALIFPTAEMRDFVARQHPGLQIIARSTVIPHGFDPTLYTPPAPPQHEKVSRISMFGSFYGPRSPEPLLNAVARLAEKPGKPNFTVEIYGRNSDVLHSALARYPQLRDIVRHMGEVDHVSALRVMAGADILAMIDAPMPPPSIFMPSKLADYIGANRPILAITPEGAAADIARMVGGVVASPNNYAQIAEALEQLLEKAKSEPDNLSSAESHRDAFRISELSISLATTIERAIAKCASR